jgi:hypothetical protein
MRLSMFRDITSSHEKITITNASKLNAHQFVKDLGQRSGRSMRLSMFRDINSSHEKMTITNALKTINPCHEKITITNR